MDRDNATEIVRQLYRAAVALPEPFPALTDAQKQYAQGLVTRYEEAATKHGTLPHADTLYPMLLSKSGRYDDALALAVQQYERSPSWNCAVAVANAARRAGDLERAVAMFEKGVEHDPKDVTCFLEIGDIRLEQDRCGEALAAYEKALAKDAQHQWALPSAFYCRHRLGLVGNWLASLREVATQEGCTCGMQGCLTAIFGGYGSERGIERAKYLLAKAG